jgi:hypothetical protein
MPQRGIYPNGSYTYGEPALCNDGLAWRAADQL